MSEQKKINWEEVSFGIITQAGMAKSNAMQAIFSAKKGEFEKSREFLAQANKDIDEASHKHMEVITLEAQGVQHPFSVLFLHAEDQLLTTQTLILVAKEFVDLYETLKK